MKSDCAYTCEFHRGKVEFHHPIAEAGDTGIFLCEAHHSIIQGRKKRYAGEIIVNKSLDKMRAELKLLEEAAVVARGYMRGEINKR